MAFTQNTDTTFDGQSWARTSSTDSCAEILELLSSVGIKSGNLFLDFGCGCMRLAGTLKKQLGLNYIGITHNPERANLVRKDGLSVEELDIDDTISLKEYLKNLMQTSDIAAVSLVGVMEYLSNPHDCLALLNSEMSNAPIPLLVSLPNICRRDIGLRLAFGHLDLRAEGLLDRSPVQLYTEEYFIHFMKQTGWYQIASCDIRRSLSQCTEHSTHPFLSAHTPIGGLLQEISDVANGHAETHQFVRMFLPGPMTHDLVQANGTSEKGAPFLSVITRTQGRRSDSLRDVLLCLSAQTCMDFEVIIIGHKLLANGREAVGRIINQCNPEIKSRIKFVELDHGNRTAPLNFGCAHAKGSYFAILDDDDIVFANWIEVFKDVAKKYPGQIARSISVSQKWRYINTMWSTGALRSISNFKSEYQTKFCLLDHLEYNRTPPVSIAFPRAVFADLNFRFDESLTTTEDWDFFIRVALICGVRDSEQVTSIYRHWDGAESSYTEHGQQEWDDNHAIVLSKFNRLKLILSRSDMRSLEGGRSTVVLENTAMVDPEREGLLLHTYALLNSSSWRISSPLRWCATFFGRPRFVAPAFWHQDVGSLRDLIQNIENSRSWRITRPLRELKKKFSG